MYGKKYIDVVTEVINNAWNEQSEQIGLASSKIAEKVPEQKQYLCFWMRARRDHCRRGFLQNWESGRYQSHIVSRVHDGCEADYADERP